MGKDAEMLQVMNLSVAEGGAGVECNPIKSASAFDCAEGGTPDGWMSCDGGGQTLDPDH